MSKDSLGVDDVGGSEGGSVVLACGVLIEATIFLSYLFPQIRDEWELYFTNASILSRLHCPLSVRVLGVHRTSQDFAVDPLKVFVLI